MRFVDLDAVKALLEGDIGEASAEALQMYGELQQVRHQRNYHSVHRTVRSNLFSS